MNLDNIEKALNTIATLLETESSSATTIEPLLLEVYESLVKKYRPITQSLPVVTTKIANDLSPIIVALINIISQCRSQQAVAEAYQEYSTIRAGQRFKYLGIYQEAGFTREEAILLILQDISSASVTARQMGNNRKSE